jgi:uncharacterized protein (UPF0332 family)
MKTHSIENIIEKAADCLDDSQEFMSLKRFEGSLNRSYYAMFHCIHALLETINFSAKSHKGAHNAFHKNFILTEKLSKNYGLALKRTFERRQFSDYDYDEVSYEAARESLENANEFLQATIAYLKENNHLQ